MSRIKSVIVLLVVLAIGAFALHADSEALPESAVVSADWLEANLENPAVRLIEVSVNPGVYERGHIPGAVNVAWHTQLVDPVRRDIITREAFEALVRSAGINTDSTIVLYGDTNNWFAAWGAWIFEIYGAQDVRLLDGGRVKWEADGRELTTRVESPAEGNFVASEPNLALRAFLPEVLEVVYGETEAKLVDIRSVAEYNGEVFAPQGIQELSIRAGHIPTAINVPWGKNVNEDGTFKSVAELRELYASLGIDGTSPIITYCRIGERASLTWFVLHRILGYEAQVYDGSWTEYGNTVGLPIENPAGTVWGAQ